MTDITIELLDSEQYRQGLLALLSKIASAKDIPAASLSFDEHLENYGAQLLSVKFCDSAEGGNIIRPFFGYPDGVAKVSGQLIENGGCPFTKESMRRMEAFDSCTIDRTVYDTLLDRRFFQEIDKLEHRHIAIVPIMIGRAIALFTIGLGVEAFKGRIREIITETIGQIAPAFIDRFPEIKTIFEQKHLSDLERKVLVLYCEGCELADIETEIGLSELTIRHLIQNASRKLEAKNPKQLIYIAIALGEIPPSKSRKMENSRSYSVH